MIKLPVILSIISLLFLCLSGCSRGSDSLTLQDIGEGLQKTGVVFKEKPPIKTEVYNLVAPTTLFESADGQRITIYIYKSENEMKKGFEELQNKELKMTDYGFHDTAMSIKNVMLLCHAINEKTYKAINNLKFT